MNSTLHFGIGLALSAVLIGCSDEDDATSFTSSPSTTASVGQEYTYNITTSDQGDEPRTITGVVIPPWLTFTDHGDGTALLRGVPTPSDVGAHPIELRLDVADRTATQNFEVDVTGDFVEVAEDDEFDSDELQPFWRYYDPRGDSDLSFEDGRVSIAIPGGVAHDLWRGNENMAPRLLQTIEDQDFGVEIKFDSVPKERFQIQGLVAQETDQKLVRLDFHHNGSSLRVYAAYIDDMEVRVRVNRAVEGPTPNRLRALRNGEYWTLQYSADGEDWQVASAFSQPLVVREIGFFVGNAQGATSPAFTGVIDYFRNTDLSELPDIDLPDGPDIQPERNSGGEPPLSPSDDDPSDETDDSPDDAPSGPDDDNDDTDDNDGTDELEEPVSEGEEDFVD